MAELPKDDFNLEDEYGDLLDLLDTYISEVEPTVEHYGVKGMKWGVRKADRPAPPPLKSLGPDSVTRKTKNGETITLQKVQPNKWLQFLGRHSKNFRDEYSKQAQLNILDGSGKKVGDAMVQKRSKDELYLEWLGIHKSARGKGYASAVMKAGRDFGKQEGFKKMVLEVPGNSPDARHIYEKLGFKYVGEVDGGAKDLVWGGLANMEYDFDAKHSSVEVGDIVHYGVKGMKWGVHKDDDVAGRFQPTSSGPKIDPRIHPSSQEAAREVSKLIQERYGYTVRSVKSFGPGHPEYERGTLGFVQNNGKDKAEGDIHVSVNDSRGPMKASEKAGWVGKGCGNPTAFLTHESAHAIFHSRERHDRKTGAVVGGNRDARIKAGAAMMAEIERARIPPHKQLKKLSGYAAQSGTREEIEAELFSQYHWHPDPPSFVKAWGETLHKELGIDGTPFRERS